MAQGQKESLDTLDVLAGAKLYVKARDVVHSYTRAHGTATLAPVIQACGPSACAKLNAIKNDVKGSGLQVDTFRQVLIVTDKLGGEWVPSDVSIGGKRQHDSLRAQLPLTPRFLRLLGYYIAEGNHQPGYITIANRDSGIRDHIKAALDELGMPFSVRACSDFQISSAALTKLFSRLCGNRADDKHLPEFWPELSDESLATCCAPTSTAMAAWREQALLRQRLQAPASRLTWLMPSYASGYGRASQGGSNEQPTPTIPEPGTTRSPSPGRRTCVVMRPTLDSPSNTDVRSLTSSYTIVSTQTSMLFPSTGRISACCVKRWV